MKSAKLTATALTALLCLVCLALPAAADVIIAQYDFTSSSLASSDTDPDTTASDFVIDFSSNAGTTSTNEGTVYARSTVVDGDTVTPGDEAGAISLGNYFSFTVEPAAGQQIDLTTLSFDFLLDADPTADPTPAATWFVKTSSGGFGAGDPTVGSRNPPVSQTDTAFETIDPLMDMSGLPTLTSSTEFRLYIYDNQNSSGIPHRLDNVILRGDVGLIPEPATFWMLALAAAVAMRRRGVSA